MPRQYSSSDESDDDPRYYRYSYSSEEISTGYSSADVSVESSNSGDDDAGYSSPRYFIESTHEERMANDLRWKAEHEAKKVRKALLEQERRNLFRNPAEPIIPQQSPTFQEPPALPIMPETNEKKEGGVDEVPPAKKGRTEEKPTDGDENEEDIDLVDLI